MVRKNTPFKIHSPKGKYNPRIANRVKGQANSFGIASEESGPSIYTGLEFNVSWNSQFIPVTF